MQENLFKEFTKVSAEEWKQKIISDLKGKPLESINWNISDEIILKPFYTDNDTKNIDFPILRKNNTDWQIGEIIEVKDFKKANKQTLECLMKGITAPVFHFYKLASQKEINVLFENISIEFIFTHFTFENDGIDYYKFYTLWKNLLEQRKLESTFACFDFDAKLLQEDENLENMAKIVSKNKDFAQETININCKRFNINTANIPTELQNSISKAKEYLDYFISKGIKAEQIAKQTYFTINIGLSYLLEVAKIRALKLLWVELLESYKLEANLPFIKVEFAENAYLENKSDNLINATSLCMSAVLGGANHIIVKPTENSEKGRRLARNVQLILKHESGFNQITDPLAGSYYIEKITDKLLHQAKNINIQTS